MNNTPEHPRNLFKAIQTYYTNLHREEITTFRNARQHIHTSTPNENLQENMNFSNFQWDSSSSNARPFPVIAMSFFQPFLNNNLSSVILLTLVNVLVVNTLTNHLLTILNAIMHYSMVFPFSCSQHNIISPLGPPYLFIFKRYTILTSRTPVTQTVNSA